MTLTQPLHRGLQQAPDRPYTIFGSRTFTNAQTADRVSRLASALQDLGVRPDDTVAILALNSDLYLQSVLATCWADAVTVPVNTRWSVKEIAYSLIEAEVKAIFVDDSFAPLADQLVQECPDLRTVIHCGEDDTPADMLSMTELIASSEPVADALRQGDALAGIFYTGGTTGFPKGVMLSHANMHISALGFAATNPWTQGGRMLHVAPMFHLAALGSWAAASISDVTHVVMPTFDPVAILAAVSEQGVTDMLLVPTMIQMLVDHPEVDQYDLGGVRKLAYGASPISEALMVRMRKAFPCTEIVQAYGMTELAPTAAVLTDADHEDPVLRRAAGRAAAHVRIKIVDENGIEVPRGTFGEIAVKGGNVMVGYLKNPEETAKAVRDGWMHTGDGGYMDEQGYVFIADRIKDMIISGGENVYSTEVENAVALHPAVASCAVIGVPDREWGERVHAVVSLVPGAELTAEELREHCRREIAGYKCPRSMEIVTEFPMSAAGKILKRDLRAMYTDTQTS